MTDDVMRVSSDGGGDNRFDARATAMLLRLIIGVVGFLYMTTS